jgi:hypothetical protein
MSADATTPSNKTLDEIILGAGNTGEMTERLRQYNLDIVSGVVSTPPPSQPAAAPAAPVRMNAFRVIYPFGNSRFELIGVDEKDLDAQEAAIRKIYEGK